MRFYLILGLFLIIHAALPAGQNNIDMVLEKCITKYDSVNNYICYFNKKELVDGEILEERNILFKYMKPEHFYMKWTEGKSEGNESIYVKGKYDNQLVVHLGSFFGLITVSIDPRGGRALKHNRHAIMEAGLGHIINLIDKNYYKAKNNQELNITACGDSLLGKDKVFIYKAVFPKDKGYYGHIIDIYFDCKFHLPIKITVYGWEKELLEDYQFHNLKLNAGLTEKDFDTENPEYDF